MKHLEFDHMEPELFLFQKAVQTHAPINGSVELLPVCNMNCNMCYVRISREEADALGGIKPARDWIALGKQMQEAGVLFLLRTGGEPLLHPDFKEIYLEYRRMGFIVTINTNGTLIDGEWADFFAQNPPRRLNITLYGMDDETYERLCHYKNGFTKVTNALALLKERNIPVKISASLTPENKDQVDSIYNYGKSMGMPVHMDSYMMAAKRERNKAFDTESRLAPKDAAVNGLRAFYNEAGEEVYYEYIKQTLKTVEADEKAMEEQKTVESDEIAMEEQKTKDADTKNEATAENDSNSDVALRENVREQGCYAGRCSFAVSWQGNLKPCVITSGPSANAFASGFKEAWDTVTKEYLPKYLPEKCTNCKYRSLCDICSVSAAVETGNENEAPEYLCAFTEERVKEMQRQIIIKENHP